MSEMVEKVAAALYLKHRDDKLELIRSGKISASMSGIEYYDGGWEGAEESARAYMRGEARAAIDAMLLELREADQATCLVGANAISDVLNREPGRRSLEECVRQSQIAIVDMLRRDLGTLPSAEDAWDHLAKAYPDSAHHLSVDGSILSGGCIGPQVES